MKFLTGLLIFVLGIIIIALTLLATQIPSLGFVTLCGWILGLVLLAIGGGRAIGCRW